LAGVDVAIVERRISHDLAGLRVEVCNSRTIEVFDQRGIADRFLSQGQLHRMGITFCTTPPRISALYTRGITTCLHCGRTNIERILAGWVDELEVVSLSRTRSDWLCAGRRRRQRLALGRHFAACRVSRRLRRWTQCRPQSCRYRIFPVVTRPRGWLIAEAQISQEAPGVGHREDATGTMRSANWKGQPGKCASPALTEQQ